MRFTALSVLFGLLGLYITVASPQQTNGSVDPANLSTCVTTCSRPILQQYQCQPGQSCFCNTGAVNAAIESCLRSNCPVEDQLAAKKYEADTCGLPVRSQSSTDPVVWTLFALACFLAFLRFFNRCPQTQGIGYWWDDYTLWIICLPMIALTVVGYLARQHGIGRDVWEISVSEIILALKLFWVGEPLYILTVYGTKVSFLLLYLRVWKDDSTFRLLCWSLIGIIAAAFVAFEFATIFQCVPVHYNWTGFVGGQATCDNQEAQIYTNAAFNILFDVAVLLLPVRALLGLKLTTQKKVGLYFIYLVGWTVVICACVRMRYLVKFGEVGVSNVTWYSNYIGLWSMVEALLGVICVCLPTSVGVTIRTLKKVQHHRNSRHITECDEKNLTERPARTLRTSAYVNNSSIVLDEESAVGKEVLEPQLSSSSNASDAHPRGSDSSVDLEQIANTLAFQDRTMPAVEEQRRKEAAKKVVTELLRNLEKKHPSRTELSRPTTREARRSADSAHRSPSISWLDEAVEPEDEGDIKLEHKKSMLPCEDPPPLTEELIEQHTKERASASSGVEPTTKYLPQRPSMDSRRLSSRSAQSESAAGSVHAFYDNVNAEPYFTDISPEEAKHRADLQEFRAWRTILPSEIPLRDEDVGRTSRDKRRALSTRSRTRSSRGLRRTQSMVRTRSSPSRTRASSCESSGDVLEPRSPLKHRSQTTSALYAEVQNLYNQHQARSRSPPCEQQSTESLEQSATYEPSADFVEPPAPYEAEHRTSEPQPSANFQQSATYEPSAEFPEPPSAFEAEHRVSDPSITAHRSWQNRNPRGVSLRYRGPPPRNSDGSTSTNDDSYHGHGVSLSFEGEQRISEANTPADELNDPYHSHNRYGSERSLYEPRQVYRRSDGSSSSAASTSHPLRSQGMSDIYSHSSSKRTSYFAPQRHHSHRSYTSFQSAAKDGGGNVGGVSSPFRPSPIYNDDDASPSPVISPPDLADDSDSVSPPPIRRHRSASDSYAAEYASSMDSIPRTSDDESTVRPSTAYTYRSPDSQMWNNSQENSPIQQTRPPSTMSFAPSVTVASTTPAPAPAAEAGKSTAVATNDFALSFPSPSESEILREEEEERLRRLHAAETVFNLVVESREQANKLPEEFSSSNSSLESSSNSASGSAGRPRNGTRSLTAAPSASSQLSSMMDFHTRGKLFDEEVKRLKQRQMRSRSYGLEKKDEGKVKVNEEKWSEEQKVLSPHPKASPPSVSKLSLEDGRKLVIGREQVDLCVE